MTAALAAAAVDWTGFAPLQPFPDLPVRGVDRYYGVECFDLGEDGDMVILGHVGVLRAVAVFHARLRTVTDDRHEPSYVMHDVATARESVRHLWAVKVARCPTYPMCRSTGPAGDGWPCHDERGEGFDDHDWSEWSDRSAELTKPTEVGLWLRWCDRCNLYEADPPRAGGTNRCGSCVGVDDSGDFYLDCDATPDTPGAFPVTYWLT